MRWHENTVCLQSRDSHGHASLAKGGWDRTERTKKRQRRGPATAPPCCVCVPEPSNTNTKRYGRIMNYLTSFSQQAFSMVAWNIVAGVRTTLGRLLLPLEWNRKNAVLLCFGCPAAALGEPFGFNLNYGTKTCDDPETQEQIF